MLCPLLLLTSMWLAIELDQTRAELAALRDQAPPNALPSATPAPPPLAPIAGQPGAAASASPPPSTGPGSGPRPSAAPPPGKAALGALLDQIDAALRADRTPDALLERLLELDTPAARRALVDLFLREEFAEPRFARLFGPALLKVDDPRLGPLANARYRHYVSEGATSWVTMKYILPLVARSGGAAGRALLATALQKGPGKGEAWKSLHHATDPAVLDLAVAALRDPLGPATGEQGVEGAVALLERFGPKATARLEALERRPDLPKEQREVLVESLGQVVSEGIFNAYLAAYRADTESGGSFLALARAGAARAHVTASQADRLRRGVVRLIDDPEHGRSALYAIEYRRLYQTPEIQRTLEDRIARAPDGDHRRALKQSLRAVRRALRR